MTNDSLFTGIFALFAALVFTVPLSAMDNKNITIQTIPKEITQGDAVLVRVSCPYPLRSIQLTVRDIEPKSSSTLPLRI
jgi:hypothetical protein